MEQSASQQIAAGYATEGVALELGSVFADGAVDPGARVRIPFATLNRHGLVAGATGTGKATTLQGIAEQLSAAGVPVLLADVKQVRLVEEEHQLGLVEVADARELGLAHVGGTRS